MHIHSAKTTKTKAIYLFLFLSFILSSSPIHSQTKPKIDFPIPTGVNNLLFYVQRTINANTIVYTLNIKENKELNSEKPLKIKWINYAKDSLYEDLNFIQNKYAYGIEVQSIEKEKMIFSFNFVSYKKKTIYVFRYKGDNKMHAFINLNNELIIIERIFVQIDGGPFWVPNVKYIEVSGLNLKHEKVSVKIIP